MTSPRRFQGIVLVSLKDKTLQILAQCHSDPSVVSTLIQNDSFSLTRFLHLNVILVKVSLIDHLSHFRLDYLIDSRGNNVMQRA